MRRLASKQPMLANMLACKQPMLARMLAGKQPNLAFCCSGRSDVENATAFSARQTWKCDCFVCSAPTSFDLKINHGQLVARFRVLLMILQQTKNIF